MEFILYFIKVFILITIVMGIFGGICELLIPLHPEIKEKKHRIVIGATRGLWIGGWVAWWMTLQKVCESSHVSSQLKEVVEKIYWGSWGVGIGIVIGGVVVGRKWKKWVKTNMKEKE